MPKTAGWIRGQTPSTRSLPTAWASVWPEAASNQPTQRAGTKLMEVLYDLPGTGAMTVRMEVPADKS